MQRDLATGFLGDYGFNVGFTGNPVADMLLGYYTGAALFQPAAFSVPGSPGNPREFNFLYVAPYVQDDWKVSSRLTVNLGLRYDYRNTPYETNEPHGVAEPQLRARRTARRRQSLAAGWHHGRRVLPACRLRAAP